MRSLRKILLVACAALLLGVATAAVSFAQLREPSGLLRRLWPFGRQHRPVPLASDTAAAQGEQPLIAPFVVRKIDINTCTLVQLQNLAGVGPAMGAHLFTGRPYRNYEDLLRDGVPLNVVQGLRGTITFGR